MGWLFDAGVTVETLAAIFAVWAFAGWLLLMIVIRRWKASSAELGKA